MSTRRSVRLGALALAAALAMAGCGSSSSSSSSTVSVSSFKSAFAADKASFSKLGTDVANAVNGAAKQTNGQIQTEFASLATRATQTATTLRNLQAPAQFKPALNKLATAFDTVAADLNKISSAASSGNGTSAESASAQLVKDSAALKAVDTTLSGLLGISSGSNSSSSSS